MKIGWDDKKMTNSLKNPDIESIRKDERQKVMDELWEFCLSNGAVDHGDLVGLPQDAFFPLKLIKKIAEMHNEASGPG